MKKVPEGSGVSSRSLDPQAALATAQPLLQPEGIRRLGRGVLGKAPSGQESSQGWAQGPFVGGREGAASVGRGSRCLEHLLAAPGDGLHPASTPGHRGSHITHRGVSGTKWGRTLCPARLVALRKLPL